MEVHLAEVQIEIEFRVQYSFFGGGGL